MVDINAIINCARFFINHSVLINVILAFAVMILTSNLRNKSNNLNFN